MSTVASLYSFFRNYAGLGSMSAVHAIALARDSLAAKKRGLYVDLEDEDFPWDGECPAPKYLVCVVAYQRAELYKHNLRLVTSLGMVGVESMNDPYLEIVKAETLSEALAILREEDDLKATEAAQELMSRATYAAGGVA